MGICPFLKSSSEFEMGINCDATILATGFSAKKESDICFTSENPDISPTTVVLIAYGSSFDLTYAQYDMTAP